MPTPKRRDLECSSTRRCLVIAVAALPFFLSRRSRQDWLPRPPFPSRPTGRKPPLVSTLLRSARAPLLKAPTGSAGPLLPSRTLPNVRNALSATVEQEKPDTARRVSGDSKTSGQINQIVILLNAGDSQLSSSRTGSEPPAPLGVRQRPPGAAKATLWPYFAYK